VKVFTFDPGLVPGKGLVRRGSPISRFIFRRILPPLTHTPLPVVPTSPVALRRAYLSSQSVPPVNQDGAEG